MTASRVFEACISRLNGVFDSCVTGSSLCSLLVITEAKRVPPEQIGSMKDRKGSSGELASTHSPAK